MRIGLVTGEYPPMQGGVGAFTRMLARALADEGHHAAVFTHATASDDDRRVNLFPQASGWSLSTVRQVNRWAQELQLDIVNLQFQTAAYAMSPWVHFLPNIVRSVPVVTTFHDLRFPYLFPKAGPLRPWIVRHLAHTSAGVIVTNHEDGASLSTLPRCALIPIGSNVVAGLPSSFDRGFWRQQAGATPDDFLIAYFGFINRSKGVETLLDSLKQLHDHGVPARLVMIGGRTGSSDPTNAAFADEIDRKITALDLTAIVHWTGFVDDHSVAAWLAAADVIALPFRDGASYRRGSLMAAVQHACTIVTTSPAVPIPAFTDGEPMLLVPPDDSAALVATLTRLYEKPELQATLRERSARLAALFDWQVIARQTAAFFDQVRETTA